jgi:hypothetical protein
LKYIGLQCWRQYRRFDTKKPFMHSILAGTLLFCGPVRTSVLTFKVMKRRLPCVAFILEQSTRQNSVYRFGKLILRVIYCFVRLNHYGGPQKHCKSRLGGSTSTPRRSLSTLKKSSLSSSLASGHCLFTLDLTLVCKASRPNPFPG